MFLFRAVYNSVELNIVQEIEASADYAQKTYVLYSKQSLLSSLFFTAGCLFAHPVTYFFILHFIALFMYKCKV